tara:strand:- start:15116 stop:15367 length:252 start_codon:yes stop_codon:yes gene_type:complete
MHARKGEAQLRGVHTLPSRQAETKLREVQALPPRQAEIQVRGAARADPPSSKRVKREQESSPEIKQEPFTIQGAYREHYGFGK